MHGGDHLPGHPLAARPEQLGGRPEQLRAELWAATVEKEQRQQRETEVDDAMQHAPAIRAARQHQFLVGPAEERLGTGGPGHVVRPPGRNLRLERRQVRERVGLRHAVLSGAVYPRRHRPRLVPGLIGQQHQRHEHHQRGHDREQRRQQDVMPARLPAGVEPPPRPVVKRPGRQREDDCPGQRPQERLQHEQAEQDKGDAEQHPRDALSREAGRTGGWHGHDGQFVHDAILPVAAGGVTVDWQAFRQAHDAKRPGAAKPALPGAKRSATVPHQPDRMQEFLQ